ncbi:DUF3696 domain-containing protein [Yinghuangia aomiensis]|uniref:DUF3696 domain-containing protein n=1 Tax=Yinghuangia aomiensis TaxID=676205 RepID=A0ABP9GZ98_9ACTN
MLEALRLANFKAFDDVELPLGPLTLLTGQNSSGKSTALQAMALIQQSYTGNQLDYEVRAADPQSYGDAAAWGARLDTGGVPTSLGFLLNGELVELGTGEDVLYERGVLDAGEDDRVVRIGLRDRAGLVYEWGVDGSVDQDLLPLVDLGVPALSEGTAAPEGRAALYPSFLAEGFQYLHADRISPATSYPRSHLVAVDRGFLGTHGEHTVNYLRHHADSQVPEGPLRHPRAVGFSLLEQVQEWLRDLCPGVNVETSVIQGTDDVRLSYGFGDNTVFSSTRRRRPTNMGFGLTNALPVVVACLTARPGSLVLIENPEAHLHPQGQTRMAALAAAAAAQGAQLIIETHSDHVVNGARLAVKQGVLSGAQTVVHYFRGNETGRGVDVASPRVGDDGKLDHWPDGFFDEFENTLDQLLD